LAGTALIIFLLASAFPSLPVVIDKAAAVTAQLAADATAIIERTI
jgi:hypothetical protein